MIFNSWSNLWIILIKGVIIYPYVILILRMSGKRTPSKFNIFDWVVAVAYGAIIGSFLISSQISFAEGFLALALLTALQFTVTWLNVRSGWFTRMVKSKPTLLYYRGKFYHKAMLKTRIPKTEILQITRERGVLSMNLVEAVVLENNGRLSIIRKAENQQADVLEDVETIE